jgi:hypothetical protein
MDDFFRSMSGRIMLLSVAISLLGGGAAALVGHGEGATLVLSASLFLPIVMNIVALPQAIEEHWYHAVLAVILLPVLLFLWAVGAGITRELHPALAYPFLALGFGALAAAARPRAVDHGAGAVHSSHVSAARA